MSMNRTVVNIVIDLTATVLFLSMLATGYLLRFPLPPGSNKVYSLWGLTRHQWGDLHFWVSLGLILVMLVHLALHWNWIVTMIGKQCGLLQSNQPPLLRCAAWSIVAFLGLCLGFAWLAETSVKKIDRPGGGHCSESGTGLTGNTNSFVSASSKPESKQLVWNDIYPIFASNCLVCHGPDRQSANFRVDRRSDLFRSEAALVLPGQSEQSPLIAIISGERANLPMAEQHKLNESDLDRVKAWIEQGAK